MPATKKGKKIKSKPKTKPRAKKSKSNKVTVTQNTKVTVSGAGGGGGGGGYGPPIVYATYAPPIPTMQTSATWESGRGFEPERREMPKFARDAMAQTTSNAAAQTSNKVAQSAMDSYRKMFSGRRSRETQTLGVATSSAAAQTLGVATSSAATQTSKATYAPRDPVASTSATWESGTGFKPEKREPVRLTDHGVTITPKHASVQTQATSEMSVIEIAALRSQADASVARIESISTEDPRLTAVYKKLTAAIERKKKDKKDLQR
jgi:hypothetical protein